MDYSNGIAVKQAVVCSTTVTNKTDGIVFMNNKPSEKVRNFAIAGHAGSGKTALSDLILFKSGAVARLASVDQKTTVSDYRPEEQEKGLQVVQAEVPLAEMFSYSTQLRSLTQGRGSFDMEFARYEQVPANIAKDIQDRATNDAEGE